MRKSSFCWDEQAPLDCLVASIAGLVHDGMPEISALCDFMTSKKRKEDQASTKTLLSLNVVFTIWF
jgi:hypothetical protein